MEEEQLKALLLLVMIILELVMIGIIASKVRAEKSYMKKCRKLSAVVKSVTKERVSSKTMMYSFVMKAEDDCIYNIHSCGSTAALLSEGNTVDILVPDGVVGKSEEDEYFEQICMRGREALDSLSQEEKIRLNQYLDRRLKNRHQNRSDNEQLKFPSLVADGGGVKQEIFPMCIIAAVIAAVITGAVLHMLHLIS